MRRLSLVSEQGGHHELGFSSIEAITSTVRAMQAKLTGRTSEPAPERIMVNALRMLVTYLSGHRASDEMLVTALLGEAETSLPSLEGFRVEQVQLPAIDAAKIELRWRR